MKRSIQLCSANCGSGITHIRLICLCLVALTALTGCGAAWSYWVQSETCQSADDMIGQCSLEFDGLKVHVIASALVDTNKTIISIVFMSNRKDSLSYYAGQVRVNEGDTSAKIIEYRLGMKRTMFPPPPTLISEGRTFFRVTLDRRTLPEDGTFSVLLGNVRNTSTDEVIELGVVHVDLARFIKHKLA